MGRDRRGQLRPPGRGLDDAMYLGRIERGGEEENQTDRGKPSASFRNDTRTRERTKPSSTRETRTRKRSLVRARKHGAKSGTGARLRRGFSCALGVALAEKYWLPL